MYLVCVLVILVIIIWIGVSQDGKVLVWCLIRMLMKCFIEFMMVWCSMIGCFFWLFLFMYLVLRWLGIMKLICIVFSCQVWLMVFLRWYLIFGLQKVFLFGSFCYFMLQLFSVECSVFLVLFQVVLLLRCFFGCSVILIWMFLKLKVVYIVSVCWWNVVILVLICDLVQNMWLLFWVKLCMCRMLCSVLDGLL